MSCELGTNPNAAHVWSSGFAARAWAIAGSMLKDLLERSARGAGGRAHLTFERRRSYEKPSERRVREKAEAVRRYRKAMRKRLQREGY